MHIQGDLQAIFDALYTMGVIDPVLQKDWTEVLDEMNQYGEFVDQAIVAVTDLGGNTDAIMDELKKYDDQTLELLAVEVAREYADFHARESMVH